jgi:dienelactone hydrolase
MSKRLRPGPTRLFLRAATALALFVLPAVLLAQGGRGRGGRGGADSARALPVITDTARAALLYASIKFEDLPQANFAQQIAGTKRADSVNAAYSKGVMSFKRITYKNTLDGHEVPAYLWEPLVKRGPRGHAAMVWVHGGVHGQWGSGLLPFVREAVQRGYVIITPDYRGSTGYGKEFFDAIDYGGRELDDVASAVDYLKTLPYVDPDRIGIMGWSHGGFIAAHLAMRKVTPFKAAAAIVPVTNLVFRLSYKGPGYQRSYAAESTIVGLPFEKPDEYIKRSPLYHVEDLHIPILVHVATNDQDVNYVEDQQLIWKLRALKPDLAETMVYVDPAPWGASVGHAFSRRVDNVTHERVDSPAQIDSWNRTWTFFDWWLRPYEDHSKPLPPVRTAP